MQFVVVYIAVFVPGVAVLVAGQTVLETAVAMSECLASIDRYSCSSTYSQGLVDIALNCGPPQLSFAQNQAAQCTTRDDGAFCFGTFSALNRSATECSSVTDSSSCTSGCRDFLQEVVDAGECCVNTVFNERFSTLVFGYNIQISFNACNVETLPACESPIDLTMPDNADNCTFEEFWGRVAEYLCSDAVGQPYVDNVLETDPACTPIARHFATSCGRANDRYCLDILHGSFPLVRPTQTAFVNPFLSPAISECANYSSFAPDMCPASCKGALETAISEFGCCINMFNDTVNEVLLPHFGADVMRACGLESPGRCTSVLDLDLDSGAGSITAKAVAAWLMYAWLCCVDWCLSFRNQYCTYLVNKCRLPDYSWPV